MGRGLLFIVSGFIVIFGMIQMSLQDRQQGLITRSSAYFYEQQSRNIAASTMEIALTRLNSNILPPQPYNAEGTVDFMELGGTGTINVTDKEAFGSRVYLEIKGTIEHGSLKTVTTIKAVANRPAFSIFSYFTDEEPVIYFATGDILNGPVHTNGTFHIDGDPVFNGKVTSPNTPEEEWGSDPEYNDGFDFNVDPIELPTDLGHISDEAADGGLRFDTKIEVEFKEDGSVDIREFTQECDDWGENPYTDEWYCDSYDDKQILSTHNYAKSDFNGIISSSERIEVKGTINGKVTLHSEGDIFITGDIIYENTNFGDDNDHYTEDDDRPVSDDLLGIVSEGDVVVEKNAYDDNNDNQDLIIHASIMAMGKSFTVEEFWQGDDDGWGQLKIYGGLIQQKRGPVALSSGPGYKKYYSYDKRFLTNSTPDFPKVKRFEIDTWRESTKTH